MELFQPYAIKHLQLTEIDAVERQSENYYLVFWWQKTPLGHLYIDTNTSSFTVPRQQILDSIGKSLQYYLKDGYADFSKVYLDGGDSYLQILEDKITSPKETTKGTISVVICTRNRPKEIERCIYSLLGSSDTDFELVIVDNAPDNDLTELAVKKFPSVKYVREPRKGLDIARNTGAQNSTYGIIAYTDDDVIVDKDWIRNLKSCFNHPLTMAVTGLVIPNSLRTKAQYKFEKEWGFNKGYVPKVFDREYFLANQRNGVPAWDVGAGANMAFRREIFEIAGYFDERLDVGASGCSGDSEMWYRVLAEGWNCNYYPNLFVFHEHRDTMDSLKSQLFYYMRGNVSSLLVQYEKYKDKGNLKRVYQSLPQYYFQRIFRSILHRQSHGLDTLLTEIKGCLSGWKFYQENKITRPFKRKYRGLLEESDVRPDSLVSVIIPSYNHAHYLPEAIKSVQEQSYKYLEIIVVDDGSTDYTAELCKQYTEVKYVRTERIGLSAARNAGVDASTGSFLVFLDADDLLHPTAVETNIFYFSYFKNIVYVSGAHDKIDENGNELPVAPAVQKIYDCYEALLQGNYIAMEATVMYRRELFFAFRFDPELKACEDYDLNLRISRHFPVFSHVKKIAIYRIHTQNMSKDKSLMLSSALRVLKAQEKDLRTDEERVLYEQGIQNWTNYYSG